jgi:hypothetical protein
MCQLGSGYLMLWINQDQVVCTIRLVLDYIGSTFSCQFFYPGIRITFEHIKFPLKFSTYIITLVYQHCGGWIKRHVSKLMSSMALLFKLGIEVRSGWLIQLEKSGTGHIKDQSVWYRNQLVFISMQHTVLNNHAFR